MTLRTYGPVAILGDRHHFLVTFRGRGFSVQRPAHPDGWMPLSEREGRRRTWHVLGACVAVTR